MTTSTPPATVPPGQGPSWHTLSIEDALRAQGADQAAGLSQAEAEGRQIDGYHHVQLCQHLLRAGDQRRAAFGIQSGDARESPAAANVRLVGAFNLLNDRAGLHAQTLRYG